MMNAYLRESLDLILGQAIRFRQMGNPYLRGNLIRDLEVIHNLTLDTIEKIKKPLSQEGIFLSTYIENIMDAMSDKGMTAVMTKAWEMALGLEENLRNQEKKNADMMKHSERIS